MTFFSSANIAPMCHYFTRMSAALAEQCPSECSAPQKTIADIRVTVPMTAKNELTLICAELAPNGTLSLRSGRFSKPALCSAHGLLPRDLRRLDGTLAANQLPVILVRQSALLVNLEFLRAIVKHDGVLLLESSEMHERVAQHAFLIDLRVRSDSPFEFQVLEAMLQCILQSQQTSLDTIATVIEENLQSLERHVHWDRLRILLECKKRARSLQERISGMRDCIAELLESDADMSNMYLTDKQRQHHGRPIAAHEEVELLLESYLKTAEELASRVQLLAANIESTEDIVNIGLVGQRNDLLLLELKLGIGTFAASMGGLGASILGMNVANGVEHMPGAFAAVVAALSVVGLTAFAVAWRRMLAVLRRSTQR